MTAPPMARLDCGTQTVDGTHPTVEGHRVFAARLQRALAPLRPPPRCGSAQAVCVLQLTSCSSTNLALALVIDIDVVIIGKPCSSQGERPEQFI